ARIADAGIAVAEIADAGISVAGIAVTRISVAGIADTGIAVFGITLTPRLELDPHIAAIPELIEECALLPKPLCQGHRGSLIQRVRATVHHLRERRGRRRVVGGSLQESHGLPTMG